MTWSYRDRNHAGRILADKLAQDTRRDTIPLVLAIPNGGVAVAEPVATGLSADLDIMIVRKVQIPFNTEAGFGALTSSGNVVLNDELVSRLHLSNEQVLAAIERTKIQISDRRKAYAELFGILSPQGRDVILVDDGLASGYTMMAAVQSVRSFRPLSIVVAVPTASRGASARVEPLVDKLVCPRVETGWSFAVAEAYENWYDVPDREVIDILLRRRAAASVDEKPR